MKTISIGSSLGPEYTLLPGHVTDEEFERAMMSDGWVTFGKAETTHEWWIEGNGTYTCSNKDDPRARPFTVMEW